MVHHKNETGAVKIVSTHIYGPPEYVKLGHPIPSKASTRKHYLIRETILLQYKHTNAFNLMHIKKEKSQGGMLVVFGLRTYDVTPRIPSSFYV